MTDKAITRAARSVEAIITRRWFGKRIDGYTLEMSKECATAAIQAYLAESVGDYGELVKRLRNERPALTRNVLAMYLSAADAIERLVAERDNAMSLGALGDAIKAAQDAEVRAEAAEDTANACRVDWADVKQHLGAALDDALDRFIESTELAQQERADALGARVKELEAALEYLSDVGRYDKTVTSYASAALEQD